MKRFLITAAAIASLTVSSACSKDETGPDEHTPISAKLFGPAGQELTPSVQLARGQTIRVEIRFYNANAALETGLEAEHYAAVVFTPAVLVTVAGVSGQRFFFDVTAQNAAGTGQVQLNFGHDAAADEASFGPFTVSVP